MKSVLIKLIILTSSFLFIEDESFTKFLELGVKTRFEVYDFTSLIKLSTYRLWLINTGSLFSFDKRKTIVHIVTDALVGENGERYIGGLSPVCPKQVIDRVSTSAWKDKTSEGLDRIEHSKIALWHEVAHQLGAKHDDSNCNIMNSDAMGCFSKTDLGKAFYLNWNKKAVHQVRHCNNIALIKRKKRN